MGYGEGMRVESAVTSVSWIPSEAVAGLAKMGFTAGAVRCESAAHPTIIAAGRRRACRGTLCS